MACNTVCILYAQYNCLTAYYIQSMNFALNK